jgi:hypothetical protein
MEQICAATEKREYLKRDHWDISAAADNRLRMDSRTKDTQEAEEGQEVAQKTIDTKRWDQAPRDLAMALMVAAVEEAVEEAVVVRTVVVNLKDSQEGSNQEVVVRSMQNTAGNKQPWLEIALQRQRQQRCDRQIQK